jgi:hypothetical protein
LAVVFKICRDGNILRAQADVREAASIAVIDGFARP